LLFFNDTVNQRGIIQTIERRLFPGVVGQISGNASLMAQFTAEVNLAKDRFVALTTSIAGHIAPDDYTQTKYPIIYMDIVSGQQDYQILQDQQGNNILNIYKIIAYDANGNGTELIPVDVLQDDQSGELGAISGFYNGQNTAGAATWYTKTANGIFLQYIPNYTTNGASTGIYGLEIYITREPAYYLVTDTTKLSGFPPIFDDYLALVPAYRYANANGLSVAGGYLRGGVRTGMIAEIYEMEGNITTYYGQLNRDMYRGMTARSQNNK
jgi:hypothetical protein